MSGSFTDFLEAALLNHVFGKTTYTGPATTYVALYTVSPSDSGGGTEVAGGSYARVALTNNTTNWPNATGTAPTSKANGVAITYPTASADWGTVVAFGVLDDPTAGNLLLYGDLTTPQSVPSGVTLSFNTGSLTITLS